MPKTPVDKDASLLRSEDEIGFARQSRNVKSIPKTCLVQKPTHTQLRSSVLSPNPRHYPAANECWDSVHLSLR